MANFPIRKCVVCGEEFELKPGKPGFANRCPDCTDTEQAESTKSALDSDDRRSKKEQDEARRDAMRNLLYRKDS